MLYKLVSGAKDYLPRMGEVSQLFSTVFHRPFPADAWGQWYLNNPDGDPRVALGYHNDELVGHHALLPQKLAGGDSGSLRYFLSVSTMVHPRHRGLAGFLQMVDALHEEARNTGAACVLAFPNGSSAPLFEKLCGYRPIIQTELCNWRPTYSAVTARERMGGSPQMSCSAQFSHPVDSVYWNWRTQNNHAKCCAVGGTLSLVYKVIEPATLMLLDASVEGQRDAAECLANFAKDLGLREVRLTRYHAAQLGIPDDELIPHEGYVVRFFGFPLAVDLPDIRFNLLLSDVF